MHSSSNAYHLNTSTNCIGGGIEMEQTDIVWKYRFNSVRLCVIASNRWPLIHYNDVILDAIASQITSLTIVYSTVYSDADQRKHQSSASLAFVRGIHRWPVNSPLKWPVTRKMFSFDDVIMSWRFYGMFRNWLVISKWGLPIKTHQPTICDITSTNRSTYGRIRVVMILLKLWAVLLFRYLLRLKTSLCNVQHEIALA